MTRLLGKIREELSYWTPIGWLTVAAIIGILAAVFVPICLEMSKPNVTSGRVIGKRYSTASTTTVMMPVPNGGVVPTQRYRPERYMVTISGADDNGIHGEREWQVSPQEFDAIKVGDWWSTDRRVERHD